jgi:2Fe-2S ferredoxin
VNAHEGVSPSVLFLPENRRVAAGVGETILDVAGRLGIEIEHECGGNCACTTCQVTVESGAEHLSPMEEVERDRLSTAEGRCQESRLACQALLLGGSVTVRVPDPGFW